MIIYSEYCDIILSPDRMLKIHIPEMVHLCGFSKNNIWKWEKYTHTYKHVTENIQNVINRDWPQKEEFTFYHIPFVLFEYFLCSEFIIFWIKKTQQLKKGKNVQFKMYIYLYQRKKSSEQIHTHPLTVVLFRRKGLVERGGKNKFCFIWTSFKNAFI